MKQKMRDTISRTPEYKSMACAYYRCTSPLYHAFPRYGGSGVKFNFPSIIAATEWVLANIGTRPSQSHSIDRYPNKDGHYEPGNLRWATKREQALNRERKTHCHKGHPFDAENTLIKKRHGERACRACTRERMRIKRGSVPRYADGGGFRRP